MRDNRNTSQEIHPWEKSYAEAYLQQAQSRLATKGANRKGKSDARQAPKGWTHTLTTFMSPSNQNTQGSIASPAQETQMEPLSDPRLGKTSASKFHITANCEGQQQFINSLPPEALAIEINGADEESAASGTAVHLALQTGDTSKLDDEQMTTYNDALKWLEKIIDAWRLDNGITEFQELQREQRLWIHNSRMEPSTSGQLDRAYIAGKHFLAVDFKTLFCTNLTPAESNWQGRVQAVAAWKEYDGLEKIRFALCKPRVRWNPTDSVDYILEDLQYAEQDIHFRVWRSEQPDAQRHAGSWCRFCPGKAFCKEAAAMALLPSVIAGDALPAKAKERDASIAALVSQLQPADLKQLWSRKLIIEKVLTAVVARLKGFDNDTLKDLGLSLGKPRTTRKVNNTLAAFNALKAYGCTEEELWSVLELPMGKTVDMLQAGHEFTKDHATEWLREFLKQWLESKDSESPIEYL